MGKKVSLLIKAGKLYAVIVVLYLGEYTVCDTLGSLSLIVARKHTVDVGVVHCPETLSDVHRIIIHAGDDQYLAVLSDTSLCLQLFQLLDHSAANIHLLHFVSAHCPHYCKSFPAVSEAVADDVELFTVG